MSIPKPFQKATIQAAVKAFHTCNSSRRFLVADEVGLGKTVVAQHIILNMMLNRQKPLVVFYVCSNLSIASQNRRKLLEILDHEDERNQAQCAVDRLTLLPVGNVPTHPKLHLYSLTPDTSVPMRQGHRRDGRQEERALIQALIETYLPKLLKERGKKFLQRYAHSSWKWWLDTQRIKVQKNLHLQKKFNKSILTEFSVKNKSQLLSRLRGVKDDLAIISHFRNALAAAAIEDIKPDLVIFDEFQRFRDLVGSDIDESASRVVGRLRGDNIDSPPALLLLSATPYRLYSQRWEDMDGNSNYQDFFSLIEFLYGGDSFAKQKRAECEAAFLELQQGLWRWQSVSNEAKLAKQKVEVILQPIIARTERASLPGGWQENSLTPINANVQTIDLDVFRHLSASFAVEHRSNAVPFWTSIPLPMQTMGRDYITWQKANSIQPNKTPGLDPEMRKTFIRPEQWPHPRLRNLINSQQLSSIALPWSAPSLPWWKLGEEWEKQNGKCLIFSRFQAVPKSIAAFISYDVECNLLANQAVSYQQITKRRRLQARPTQHNLLAIFNPWPWLSTKTDPLASKRHAKRSIAKVLQDQIRDALNQLGVQIRDDVVKNRPPIWVLLAQIEVKAGNWPWILSTWREIHFNIQNNSKKEQNPDAGLGLLLNDWQERIQTSLDYITSDEVKALADLALRSPGVAIGRALKRHWNSALDENGYYHTLNIVWNGFRTYLDQLWFVEALAGEKNYPSAIMRAVYNGNLEAVLDEHLWIISQLYGLSGSELAIELAKSLSLRSSNTSLHILGNKKAKTFTLRCHVAMPFTDVQQQSKENVEDGNKPIRADELRSSFNSPFWPNVLATTSVGQEGLDFHVWCSTLIHWDLCGNPVDLEQREGRIQRYGGLSIRRAIAVKLRKQAFLGIKLGESPWKLLASLADRKLTDPSGLSPWWICKGASIKRFIFDVPLSEQTLSLESLQKQRLLYRLVLGQPNQEELLEFISRNNELQVNDIQKLIINLSPFTYGKK